MSEQRQQVNLASEKVRLGDAAGAITRIAYPVGVLGLVASGVLGFARGADPERFYLAYLMSFAFFLSLTLGALFFVIIQHLTRAGWSVVLRRLAEGVAANATLMALLFVPLLFGMGSLYEWMVPEVVAHDHLLQAKSAYLNPVFFYVRIAVFFAVWIFLANWFLRQSTLQDETGDPGLTTKMQRMSAPAIYLFALTLTFFAFDVLMSLEPHWFSTIFGVYYFSGSALAFFSTLPILAYLLQRSGRLTGLISTEHYHDVGKLMFGFTVFWAYIAFSQYMLYWYANIPEETEWFLRRQTGQWEGLSWFLLVGRFLVPFLALISRIPKRRKGMLAAAAIWLLFVHWADMYYLVMPHYAVELAERSGNAGLAGVLPTHILDVTCFLAIGGLYVGAFATRMRNRSLVPEKDPRLASSLAFENI